jgi:hypothetical protein
MFTLKDIELNDFLSVWTLRNGQDITVCFSCWNDDEASQAAQRLNKLTSCPASIAPYDALSRQCLPRPPSSNPLEIGWVVYFPETLESQDWNLDQLDRFDEWLMTTVVNIDGASYLPRGSFMDHAELFKRYSNSAHQNDETFILGIYEASVEREDALEAEYLYHPLADDADTHGGHDGYPRIRSERTGPFKSFESALTNARLLAAEKGVDVKIRHREVVITQWFIDWEEPHPRHHNQYSEDTYSDNDDDPSWPPFDDGGFFTDPGPNPVADLIEYEQEEIRKESY